MNYQNIARPGYKKRIEWTLTALFALKVTPIFLILDFVRKWFFQKKNCFPNDECTIQIVTENPSRIFNNLMMSNLVIFCKKIFPQTIPWVNKRHLKNLGKFYWNQVCTAQKCYIVHCIDKFLMFINFRNCGMFVI